MIQPAAQGDPRLGRLGGGGSDILPQLFQLRHTLGLGFGEDILGDGQALCVPAHHDAALPPAVLSQTDAAVAVFSAFCHGAISSPK